MKDIFKELKYPNKLWTREEVMSKPCPTPKEHGFYAWYFREIPRDVPERGCWKHNDLTLLYVGISPRSETSQRNLRERIKSHFNGNAYGSTLRFSLGCLLRDDLGITLQPTSSKKGLTFGDGEKDLNMWLSQNAFVTWVLSRKPWELEEELIGMFKPPLNILKNDHHPFSQKLKSIRSACREKARNL